MATDTLSTLNFHGENMRTWPHRRTPSPMREPASKSRGVRPRATVCAAAARPTGPAPMMTTGSVEEFMCLPRSAAEWGSEWRRLEIEAQELARLGPDVLECGTAAGSNPALLTRRYGDPGTAGLPQLRGFQCYQQRRFRRARREAHRAAWRADHARDANLLVLELHLFEVLAVDRIFTEEPALQRAHIPRLGLELDAKELARQPGH